MQRSQTAGSRWAKKSRHAALLGCFLAFALAGSVSSVSSPPPKPPPPKPPPPPSPPKPPPSPPSPPKPPPPPPRPPPPPSPPWPPGSTGTSTASVTTTTSASGYVCSSSSDPDAGRRHLLQSAAVVFSTAHATAVASAVASATGVASSSVIISNITNSTAYANSVDITLYVSTTLANAQSVAASINGLTVANFQAAGMTDCAGFRVAAPGQLGFLPPPMPINGVLPPGVLPPPDAPPAPLGMPAFGSVAPPRLNTTATAPVTASAASGLHVLWGLATALAAAQLL